MSRFSASGRSWTDSMFNNDFSPPELTESDKVWKEYIRNRNRLVPGGILGAQVRDADEEGAVEKTKKLLAHLSNEDNDLSCIQVVQVTTDGIGTGSDFEHGPIIQTQAMPMKSSYYHDDHYEQRDDEPRVRSPPRYKDPPPPMQHEAPPQRHRGSRQPSPPRYHNPPAFYDVPEMYNPAPRHDPPVAQAVERGRKRKLDDFPITGQELVLKKPPLKRRRLHKKFGALTQHAGHQNQETSRDSRDRTRRKNVEFEEELKEHQTRFLRLMGEHFNEMRILEKNCDVQLLTSDDEICMAHSFVLRLSPFFDKIVCEREQHKQRPMLIAVNVPQDLLMMMLHFMYTGHIAVTKYNIFEVLSQACIMGLVTLSETCIKIIQKLKLINPKNCLQILQLAAKQKHCDALKEHILGKLWDKPDFLEALCTTECDELESLTNEIFETFIFRCGQHCPSNNIVMMRLFTRCQIWLKQFQMKVVGNIALEPFTHIGTLSHRLSDHDEYSKWVVSLRIHKDNVVGYACEINCRGCVFSLNMFVERDVDGKKYLSIEMENVTRDSSNANDIRQLPDSWYRSFGFGYTIINEDDVINCLESKDVFFGQKRAGFSKIVELDHLFDTGSGFFDLKSCLRIDLNVDPDHVTGFCIHFLVTHFMQCWDGTLMNGKQTIQSLGIDLLTFILQQDNLRVTREGVVLDVVIFWLTDEFLDIELFSEADVVKLLNTVRWKYITYEDMQNVSEILQTTRTVTPRVRQMIQTCSAQTRNDNYRVRDHYEVSGTETVQEASNRGWDGIFNNDFVHYEVFHETLNKLVKIQAEIQGSGVQHTVESLEFILDRENIFNDKIRSELLLHLMKAHAKF